MLALAFAYAQLDAWPASGAVRRGVLAAVVGLLTLTTHRLARPVFTGALPLIVGISALALAILTPINTAWIVLVAGAIGIAVRR